MLDDFFIPAAFILAVFEPARVLKQQAVSATAASILKFFHVF